MDDFKEMTVRALRDLARQKLVRGYSKLTKDQLVAALKKVPGAVKSALAPAKKVAEEMTARSRKAPSLVSAAARAVGKGKKGGAKKKGGTSEPPAKPARNEARGANVAEAAVPAAKETAPKKAVAVERPEAPQPPRAERSVAVSATRSTVASDVVAAEPVPVAPTGPTPKASAEAERPRPPPSRRRRAATASPVVEGFFLARMGAPPRAAAEVVGEDDEPSYNEELGDLPESYPDELAIALPRDPHTLFVFWAFSGATVAKAREGLSHPRSVLRVFDGDRLVREATFDLDAKSFYVEGLAPGRSYRVELFFVGADGFSRRIGAASRAVSLPREGPSDDVRIRFVKIPSGMSSSDISAMVGDGQPADTRRFVSWERISLPGSDETVKITESRSELKPGGAGGPHADWARSPSGIGLNRSGPVR